MADSSVAITAGTGTPIRVLTALGAASADQQVVTLADSAGNLLGTTGAPVPISVQGTPQVQIQYTAVKGGNTPPSASDNSFVVSISPNSPMPLMIGTAAATNTTAVGATPGATLTIGHAAATITTSVTTQAAFIAAPGAGLSIYITDINVTNGGATSSLVSLFAAGQTVPLAAKYVSNNSSASPQSLGTPIRVGTATALNYTNSNASTSIFVQVTYYIAA